jgi:hypothetical protein
MGNPPYTKPNKKDKTKLSTRSLYPDFISYSLKLLKKNGYLSYIHPISWRRYSRESRFSFDNYDILYMYTNNDYKEFGVSAPYINYYIIQNKKSSILTKYETCFFNEKYTGCTYLKNLSYMPLLISKETINILHKMNSKNENIKLNIRLISSNSTCKKSIHKDQTDEFIYKNIHNYSIKKREYIYRYSKKKHFSHDLAKIIMIYKGGYKYFNPIYDNKTIGITDNAMFMEVNSENHQYVLNFLNSDLIKFILRICNYNYGRNMKCEYNILNKFDIPFCDNIYQYFSISDEEIDFINKIIKI